MNPRILKQYKINNDIIYDVIFTAPKVNLRDHKRPESKNTFYKGFNLQLVFFLNLLTREGSIRKGFGSRFLPRYWLVWQL